MAAHRKPARKNLLAGLARVISIAGLITRHDQREREGAAHRRAPHAPRHAPVDDSPATTIGDIDPRDGPPELPTRTTDAARQAVDALHTAAEIPTGLIAWTLHPDGATGVVSQSPAVSDEDRRGVIAACAAAMKAQPEARSRDDGHTICTTTGTYPGHEATRLAVQATCCRDISDALAAFETAVRDLHPDEEQQPVPIPPPAARQITTRRRLALPAPGPWQPI
jgi:hypothetical protein